MTIQKSYQDLQSLAIRQLIGNQGIRKIDLKTGGIQAIQSPKTGILGGIINWGQKFLGWAIAGLKWLGVSCVAVWNWVCARIGELWRFDWGMTDAAIDKAIQLNWVRFGGVLGGLTGKAVGWAISFGAMKLTMGAINPVLANYIMSNVAEEAVDELFSEIASFFRQTAGLAARSFLLWAYKNVRGLYKSSKKLYNSMTGGADPPVEKESPFILRRKWEEKRIALFGDDDTFTGNFAEEFSDELGDAFFEAGLAVAQGMDSFLADQNAQINPYVVDLKINKDSEEVFKLAGSRGQLLQRIPNFLSDFQVIENRDIGIVTGLDEVAIQQKVKSSEIIITIVWHNKQKPPYSNEAVKKANLGTKIIKREYTIADVSRGKLNWATIKAAAGGGNGFTTGEICCRAKLSNGRQMQCLGASYQEAQKIVEDLVKLSDAEILYPLSFTERKDFTRSKAGMQRRESVRMYPAYVTVLTQNLIAPNNERGNKYKAGQYLKRKARIPLYTHKPPSDWDKILSNLFKTTDSKDS